MEKQKAIKTATRYFPNYPSVNKFYVTEDEQVFEDLTHAENHAKTLGKDADGVVEVAMEDCDFEEYKETVLAEQAASQEADKARTEADAVAQAEAEAASKAKTDADTEE
jgi:hypothetical protein